MLLQPFLDFLFHRRLEEGQQKTQLGPLTDKPITEN